MTNEQRDALTEEGATIRLLLGAAIAVTVSLFAWAFQVSTALSFRVVGLAAGGIFGWFAWNLLGAAYDIANEFRREE